MPRNKTKLEHNSFVGGLITEAGPLTFPENASLVDENFVLNRDGSRQRRLGMKYENTYTKRTITSIESTNYAVNSYIWKNVGNDATLDIAVFQIGRDLYFFDNNQENITPTLLNSGSPFTLDNTATTITSKFDFEVFNGYLIVVGDDRYFSVLAYDSGTDTISEPIGNPELFVRDLFGVEEVPPLAVDERMDPTVVGFVRGGTQTHLYNLRNQGWPTLNSNADEVPGTVQISDPLVWSYSYTTSGASDKHFHPSNADTIHALKLSSHGTASLIGAYNPREIYKYKAGSTHAPRGSNIISVFNRGYYRKLFDAGAAAGLPDDYSGGGIVSVASYAGRLFYAIREGGLISGDDNSPAIGTMIFYSQVTANLIDINKCYAKHDPTAEDINIPLDTDGGFITLSDAGTIYKLATLGESLFVFASKGVWEISGGENYFSATNQTVTKIADFGALSADSVVEGETSLSFWADGGIYVIQIDPTSLKGTPTNITQTTIQSLYDEIPDEAKTKATGIFDDISKQIRWLYRSQPLDSSYYYDTELIYDTNLRAFYVSNIGSLQMASGGSPYVVGHIDIPSALYTDEAEDVTAGAGGLVEVNGEQVIVTSRVADQQNRGSTKYWIVRELGAGNAEFTAGGYLDLDFKDWSDEQDVFLNYGIDAEAQLITGYTTDGDAEIEKKSKYITVYMKRTETGFTDIGGGNLAPLGESSCLLQGQWEWTNSAAAGRWTNEQEVYRLPRAYVPIGAGDPFDYSFTVVKTKNKLRGRGSALSLLFKTSPGKDLHLYGWSREVTLPDK